jgi:hypothetical protein
MSPVATASSSKGSTFSRRAGEMLCHTRRQSGCKGQDVAMMKLFKSEGIAFRHSETFASLAIDNLYERKKQVSRSLAS